MPEIKLTYFNVQSLGEPIRFLLSYLNWEFEDFRVERDEWSSVRPTCANFHYMDDESVKATRKAQVLKEAPEFLKKFDDLVKKNGGYLANGKLSWGDLYFVAVSKYISFMLGYDPFENHPNLIQLKEKVTAIPQIKAWIAKRPATDW